MKISEVARAAGSLFIERHFIVVRGWSWLLRQRLPITHAQNALFLCTVAWLKKEQISTYENNPLTSYVFLNFSVRHAYSGIGYGLICIDMYLERVY